MDAFCLLKFWRFASGDDATTGRGASNTISTPTTDVRNKAVDTTDDDDDEESFFDLEFPVPACDDEKERSDSRDIDINISDSNEDVESPNDVIFEGRFLPLESNSNSNSKPQSPISFLRSPPKFRVFMLFKKPKLEKTETTDVSPATPKHCYQQSNRSTVKYKIEEVPIFSLLARVNSSRSKLQRQRSEDASPKRFPKDLVQKYLKLIKPLYVRVSKEYSENLKSSNEFSTANRSSSPATAPVHSPSQQAEEKQGSRVAACKQLGKSRSVSSATGIMPPSASKRDDWLLQQQHDGIQSAILHCKTSYNSSRSREFSVLSRSTSDTPPHEISMNPSRNSTAEEKKRSSI